MRNCLCLFLCVLLLCGCSQQKGDPTVPQVENFRLELSEPSIVVQGEVGDDTWGHYQFPELYTTEEGYIVAQWQYGTDSITYDDILGRKVSTDGGKTWRSDVEYTINDYPTMKNGKQFLGFVRKGGHLVDSSFFAGAKGYPTENGYTLYFRDDLPKNEDTVAIAQERDPKTGEVTTFEVTVKWPNAPINVYPDGMIYPFVQYFALSNESVLAVGDTLYKAVYCRGFDAEAKNREDAVKAVCNYQNVYVFRSDDCGRTWDYQSQVLSAGRFSGDINGFSEPWMTLMPDGSVVMLMRTGNKAPSYMVRSTDGCRTWTEPKIFDSIGVKPVTVTLACGVTIASYGRPELRIRATSDPTGQTWKTSVGWDEPNKSCFYTDLIALDAYSALIIYTDFQYPNEDGVPVKTVLTRIIRVVPR